MGYKAHKLFVDPTGHHVLVSAVHKDREKDPDDLTAELLYVHSGSGKPRQVIKNVITIIISGSI